METLIIFQRAIFGFELERREITRKHGICAEGFIDAALNQLSVST
jgi:hypothetical protein